MTPSVRAVSMVVAVVLLASAVRVHAQANFHEVFEGNPYPDGNAISGHFLDYRSESGLVSPGRIHTAIDLVPAGGQIRSVNPEGYSGISLPVEYGGSVHPGVCINYINPLTQVHEWGIALNHVTDPLAFNSPAGPDALIGYGGEGENVHLHYEAWRAIGSTWDLVDPLLSLNDLGSSLGWDDDSVAPYLWRPEPLTFYEFTCGEDVFLPMNIVDYPTNGKHNRRIHTIEVWDDYNDPSYNRKLWMS